MEVWTILFYFYKTHFDKYFLNVWRGFSGLDGVTAETFEEEEEEVEAWMVGQEE